MARKARRPRPTFVRTAVALTALSFVPDLTFGFDAGSAATLITLHTVAAAIVVPTLAGRLASTRWPGSNRAPALSPGRRPQSTPLRGNPGCGGEDAADLTEGLVAALDEGLAGAAPTGHDDQQHPATSKFKVGQ